MNPGKLNSRIVIKRIVKSDDGYGGFTNTISVYNTIWGDVKQISGKRESDNGQRSTKTEVELICRADTIDAVISGCGQDWLFQVEGNSDTYRINDLFQSELKYFTKIIGTKIV